MQVVKSNEPVMPEEQAKTDAPVDQYHETLIKMGQAKELADRYHARTIGQWKTRVELQAVSGAHPEQFQREIDLMGHFFFLAVRMAERGPEFKVEKDPLERMKMLANRLGNLFRNYTNECDFVYWMIHSVSQELPEDQIKHVAVPHL